MVKKFVRRENNYLITIYKTFIAQSRKVKSKKDSYRRKDRR